MDLYLNAIKSVPAPDLGAVASFSCVLNTPGARPLPFWCCFFSTGKESVAGCLFNLVYLIPTASYSSIWPLVLEGN